MKVQFCNSHDAQVAGLPLPLQQTANVFCIFNSVHFRKYLGRYVFIPGSRFREFSILAASSKTSFCEYLFSMWWGRTQQPGQFGAAAALTHMKYQYLHLPLP